jgi:curved DNA-binding protein CbpA
MPQLLRAPQVTGRLSAARMLDAGTVLRPFWGAMPMEGSRNFYAELGVSRDATAAQIKAAFHKNAKAHHPDRPNGNAEKMARVNRAYEVLSDPDQRKRYDETGSVQREQTREEQVRAVFLQVVGSVSIEGGNIVSNARRAFNNAIKEGDKAQRWNKRVLAMVVKRMSAVWTKQPENLILQVVEARVAEGKAHVARVDDDLALLKDARRMLDAYESNEAEAPPEREGGEILEIWRLLELMGDK